MRIEKLCLLSIVMGVLLVSGIEGPAAQEEKDELAARLQELEGKPVCDGLVFTIASVQKEYLVGEPIRLKLTLENRYDREMTLVYDLEHFEFYVKREDGPYRFHLTPMQSILRVEDRIIPPTHFAPEESVTVEALLLWNAQTQQMSFAQPGRYQIRALFGTQLSNEIEVQVAEPPEYAARTLEFLHSLQLERLLDLTDYAKLTAEKLEALRKFFQEAPVTTYDWHLWRSLVRANNCPSLVPQELRGDCWAFGEQLTARLSLEPRFQMEESLQVEPWLAPVTYPLYIMLQLAEPIWSLTVIRPNGEEEVLAKQLEPGPHRFVYTSTDLPGVYRVIGAGIKEARRSGPPAAKEGCPPPPVPPVPTEEQLDFTVELAPVGTAKGPQTKSAFLLGEPIPVRIVLRNRSADPLFSSFSLDPAHGFLQLFVAAEGQPYEPHGAPLLTSSDPILRAVRMGGVLAVGGELEHSEFLQFVEPGTYRVRARLQVGLMRRWDGTYRPVVIDSRELQIQVDSPGWGEQDAFDFLKSANALHTLHPSSTVSVEIPTLLRFLEQYPQSVYAPWVEAALSRSCRESKRYFPQEPVLCPPELLQDELELQLEPLQLETLLGQPVKLELRVRNRSSHAWLGQIPLRFAEGLQLTILDHAKQEERSYRPPTAGWVQPIRLLQAGGEFTVPITVHYEVASLYTPGGLALGRPGEYRLKATARLEPWRSSEVDKRELQSNEALVWVRAPEGAESEAWEFLRGAGLEPYLSAEARLLPAGDEVVRGLQEFLRLFPQSAYRAYVQEGLRALCAVGGSRWLACPSAFL